jgi:hypothetical protein
MTITPIFAINEHSSHSEIPPMGKSCEVDFGTVARCNDNGQIIEENWIYDLVGFPRRIGLSK